MRSAAFVLYGLTCGMLATCMLEMLTFGHQATATLTLRSFSSDEAIWLGIHVAICVCCGIATIGAAMLVRLHQQEKKSTRELIEGESK